MAKGQARILLHRKREFLVNALREFRTLYEITVALNMDGVQVSISSLYRYIVSDLSDDYAEYLWHTGRGLLRSRQDKVRCGSTSKTTGGSLVVANPGKISNQADLNKFLTNNK